ncbi:hypothetical protein F5Y06DRAFT_293445 [Hypoxylon sp. FL0890]|nr:hypothetical protein F5Y06DRAFT_293445 [Hypoxylon sp. FL0890]
MEPTQWPDVDLIGSSLIQELSTPKRELYQEAVNDERPVASSNGVVVQGPGIVVVRFNAILVRNPLYTISRPLGFLHCKAEASRFQNLRNRDLYADGNIKRRRESKCPVTETLRT